MFLYKQEWVCVWGGGAAAFSEQQMKTLWLLDTVLEITSVERTVVCGLWTVVCGLWSVCRTSEPL